MNNIHVLNLAKYEPPIIEESKKNEWVTYGENNSYYQFLIDRYKNSTTNNAIINNISRLIYGKGLSAIDASRKPNEYAQMMAMIAPDEMRKVVLDFEMLGQAAFQVHYSKDRSKILKVYHIPVQQLAPEKCNKDGQIEAYFYSDNWEDTRNYVPKRIPAFGFGTEQVEIMFIQPYSVGMKYFSYVDYQGGLNYAVLEEDIANYLISEVQSSFSSRTVVNFNNGQPTPEEQDIISSKVMSKLTGTNGQRVIVAFNNNAESKTTIDSIPVDNAPDLYNQLSEECMRKIMLSHNVTSPLLFGIASTNGFSSNADELQNSFVLFDNLVIRPKQEVLLSAIDRILAFNGISLKLYFKTLKPLEFTDLENAQTEEQVAEQTGTQLSKHEQLDNEIAESLIELGEEPNENWLLIDEFPVDYDNDDAENEMLSKEVKKSLFSKLVELVSTGTANPNAKSSQDEIIDGVKFITRYVYAGETSSKSRQFCQKMMAAKKVYRKEDIIRMGGTEVNAGFGIKGAPTYDIWHWKGGKFCHHRWNKQVYANFEGYGIDVNSPKAKQIAGKKAEKYGYVVKNDSLVSTRPIDTPNRGAYVD